jgi:hypothetical protein
MRALGLQHVAVEGPGTLASSLEAHGSTLATVADRMPSKPHDGVVVKRLLHINTAALAAIAAAY